MVEVVASKEFLLIESVKSLNSSRTAQGRGASPQVTRGQGRGDLSRK